MIPPFLIPIVLKLSLVAALLGGVYLGYNHVKQIGYNEAMIVCNEKTKAYEEVINKKVDAIEALSSSLVTESRKNSATLSKDIQLIKNGVEKKPLIVIKDGECTPASTFSDTISKINNRVNQNVKGIKQ